MVTRFRTSLWWPRLGLTLSLLAVLSCLAYGSYNWAVLNAVHAVHWAFNYYQHNGNPLARAWRTYLVTVTEMDRVPPAQRSAACAGAAVLAVMAAACYLTAVATGQVIPALLVPVFGIPYALVWNSADPQYQPRRTDQPNQW